MIPVELSKGLGGVLTETVMRSLDVVMFVDMVGSTALFEADERRAVELRNVFIQTVQHHHDETGGTVVSWLGDGSLSTFDNTLDAVRTAIGIQRDLLTVGCEARVGIHLGEVIHGHGTIVGDAVNVASRIESFASPGSVLVSKSIYEQLSGRNDLAFNSLGTFRLKNVGGLLEIYSVVADGIRSPEAHLLEGKGERLSSISTRLPAASVELIGRGADLQRLTTEVRDNRLVTITGPGGVGKTSILLELGRALARDASDGVVFVPLAEVDDPDQFFATLARVLDVKESNDRDVRDGISTLLGDRSCLLLLDNFEQIIDAASDVSWLLDQCAHIRVIVTSRIPLRITGEFEAVIDPLPLPSNTSTPSDLTDNPAIDLFVRRAHEAGCRIDVSDESQLRAISDICNRLDGLPLALELAAPRLRVLSPEALSERLSSALDVLKNTNRTAPTRQQTLRATIDWSHSLLNESERALLRRIAVFAGGASVEAVEVVCADGSFEVLDVLESLVEKGLVRISIPDGRVSLLQMIREYAGERLDEADERDVFFGKYATYFATIADRVRRGIDCEQQPSGVSAVALGISEHENLHTALDTLTARARQGDVDACERAIRMCSDLLMYWHIRGMNLTAFERGEALLVAARGVSDLALAQIYGVRGLGHWALGHFDRSADDWRLAVEHADIAGDMKYAARSRMFLSLGLLGSDPNEALQCALRAMSDARELGHSAVAAFAQTFGGFALNALGRNDEAESFLEEASMTQLGLEDHEGLGLSLGGLGSLAVAKGDEATALDLYERSLLSFALIGDRAEEARILDEVAWLHLARRDLELATARFLDCIQAYADINSGRGIGNGLLGLAAVEVGRGRVMKGAVLAEAAKRFADEEGVVNVYAERSELANVVQQAVDDLPEMERERARLRASEIGLDSIEKFLDGDTP